MISHMVTPVLDLPKDVSLPVKLPSRQTSDIQPSMFSEQVVNRQAGSELPTQPVEGAFTLRSA